MSTLKPVTFIRGKYQHTRQNTAQQLLLLKALSVTQDPHELKKMIGVQRVADVFRTLDKLSMRKEFHEAMARVGIDFDLILNTFKTEMINGEKSADRLNAAKALLKSLGMDKYEDASVSGGGWEDEIIKAHEKEKDQPLLTEGEPAELYSVNTPDVPKSVIEQRKRENELGKSLYELE